LKIVIFLVALHNKPNFDLSRCYEFFPSIYKGFEIDVLRGINLKTAIVFVALHNKPNFDLLRFTTDDDSARVRRSQGSCAAH